MKFKNKLILISIILVILVCILFIIFKLYDNNNNNFKKVNLLSGQIEQTKEYKLYEFGIKENSVCKSVDNIVEEVVDKYIEDIDFEYIDVTENMSLSNLYSINSVPTFIIIDINGNVKYRKSGVMTKEELIDFINYIKK